MTVRSNLPESLRMYYDDLDNNSLDWVNRVQLVEKKKKLFGYYYINLYKIPDAYEVLGQKHDIFVYHYTVGNKSRPTVLCAPVLGGDLEVDNKGRYKNDFTVAKIIANMVIFRKRWNAVIIATNNKILFENNNTPLQFEKQLKNIIYNNIQAIQFIKYLKNTDVFNIFGVGASLGGLTITTMTGIEDSIRAAVIIVAGGPLGDVIANSTEGLCKKYTRWAMKEYSLTRSEFAGLLNASILSDTLELGRYIPDNTAFMVTAEEDTSVPTFTQENLVDIVKPAEHFHYKLSKYINFNWLKKFKNGHYQTFVLSPYLFLKAFKFLSKRIIK